MKLAVLFSVQFRIVLSSQKCRDWKTSELAQRMTCGDLIMKDMLWFGDFACAESTCSAQECCRPKTCRGVHILLDTLIKLNAANASGQSYVKPDCESLSDKNWDANKVLTRTQVEKDINADPEEYKWASVSGMKASCCAVFAKCKDVDAKNYEGLCQDAGMTRYYWDTTKTCAGSVCVLKTDCCVAKKCRNSFHKDKVICAKGSKWNDNFPLKIEDEGKEAKKCCLKPRGGGARRMASFWLESAGLVLGFASLLF